ncbi:hypothetical protein IE994_16455 [Enterobacter hormaechei]|nr:hypothetical protein [Enterobacter hormaechei]
MQSRAVGPTGATRETIKSTTDHQHSGALDNRSIALGRDPVRWTQTATNCTTGCCPLP